MSGTPQPKKRTFEDAEGREWTLRVDGNVVCDYEEATGIDLFASLAERGAAGPVPNARALMTLLYLASDAAEKDVDEKSFRAAIGGESLEQAWSALTEALYAFFPKLRMLGDVVNNLLGQNAGGITDALGVGKTFTDAQPSQE